VGSLISKFVRYDDSPLTKWKVAWRWSERKTVLLSQEQVLWMHGELISEDLLRNFGEFVYHFHQQVFDQPIHKQPISCKVWRHRRMLWAVGDSMLNCHWKSLLTIMTDSHFSRSRTHKMPSITRPKFQQQLYLVQVHLSAIYQPLKITWYSPLSDGWWFVHHSQQVQGFIVYWNQMYFFRTPCIMISAILIK